MSVSCGDGSYEKLIYENYEDINLTGTDVVDCFIKKEDIDYFNKKGIWKFIKLFPEKELPFADDAFDLVYHNDVIEHVEKPFMFLAEQFRVLKPGGQIIIGTPNLLRVVNILRILTGSLNFPKKINSDNFYTSAHHHQELTEWNIISMLKEVGFSKIEIKYCFFGLHFLNFQFKAYPQRGVGKLMSHFLMFYAEKQSQ